MTETPGAGYRTDRPGHAERAAQAYARGLWVPTTLADALAEAARTTPDRTVLVDASRRAPWCRSCCRTGMKPR